MMTYTETGTTLLATAIETGQKIQFTRVELIADPNRSAGELTHQADIALVAKKGDTTIIVKAVTDNFNFTGDYYFNQVNVYASGADGQEILFCFQRSATCPVYIPKYDGRPVQNEISVYITVTSTDAVSIVNDGVYVLQSDFEERMLQKIDVADIVQNATTRDPKKITSAAVAADLQDQICEQNTKIQNIKYIGLDLGEITPTAKDHISVPYDFSSVVGDSYRIIAKLPPCVAYTGSFNYNMFLFTNWQGIAVNGTIQMYAETSQKARVFYSALVVPK